MPPYLASHSLSDRDAPSYVAVKYGVHANRGLTAMTSTRDALFLLSLRVTGSRRQTGCACLRHERGVSTVFVTLDIFALVRISPQAAVIYRHAWAAFLAQASNHQLGSSSLCARSCGLPTPVCYSDGGEKPCALLLQLWIRGSHR